MLRKNWPEYRLEELTLFAARVRACRAILNWSQTELAARAGLTQRCIYKIENVAVDVRDSTMAAISNVFRTNGIQFDALPGGGLELKVPGEVLRASRGDYTGAVTRFYDLADCD